MSPHDADDDPAGSGRVSPFVPLLVVAGAFLAWTGFQTVELIGEHRALAATHEAQAAQVAESAKFRASLDTLASETQKLADSGNADARLIIDELKKRGITITVGKPPQPAPP
jgi:predicted DNA repair protein MutK